MEQVIEERDGPVNRCGWCDKERKGLYWGWDGGEWVCANCMENSTIEGIIEGDVLVPRFSQRYRELEQQRLREAASLTCQSKITASGGVIHGATAVLTEGILKKMFSRSS